MACSGISLPLPYLFIHIIFCCYADQRQAPGKNNKTAQNLNYINYRPATAEVRIGYLRNEVRSVTAGKHARLPGRKGNIFKRFTRVAFYVSDIQCLREIFPFPSTQNRFSGTNANTLPLLFIWMPSLWPICAEMNDICVHTISTLRLLKTLQHVKLHSYLIAKNRTLNATLPCSQLNSLLHQNQPTT
jgi:hypothetical protein